MSLPLFAARSGAARHLGAERLRAPAPGRGELLAAARPPRLGARCQLRAAGLDALRVGGDALPAELEVARLVALEEAAPRELDRHGGNPLRRADPLRRERLGAEIGAPA